MQTLLRTLKSLHLRIFLVIIMSFLVPTIAITAGFLKLYESRQIQSDISSVNSIAMSLNTQIATTGYLQDPSLDFLNAEFTALANGYSGRIMVMDSSLVVVSDTYGVDQGKTMLWRNVVQAANGSGNSYYDRSGNNLIVAVPIPALASLADTQKKMTISKGSLGNDTEPVDVSDEESSVLGVLLVVKSASYISQNIAFMTDVSWEVILISIIVSLAFALLCSSHMTMRLKKIAAGIRQAQEEAQTSLPLVGYTEAVDISEAFNAYHTKMQDMDESRNEFVSNVSHELKTPLASIKVLADSINSMGDAAPIEMYREFMGDITSEIDRENNVINDLLSLVKLDRSGVNMNISSVVMNDMMESLLKRLRPLAENSQVELVLESFRPVIAEVDETKLTLALMNLVENGIKYNHEGGYVHVSLNSDHQYCYIRVEDSGMGIPADSIDRIFERFFRVDKSHSREIGGTGLGLAITSNVIKLHHGEIRVSSEVDHGTTFDVRLPLRYIEKEDLA